MHNDKLNISKLNPEYIANDCSKRHIQSVIEDMKELLLIAEDLSSEIDRLNSNNVNEEGNVEIGSGKLMQLKDLAHAFLRY